MATCLGKELSARAAKLKFEADLEQLEMEGVRFIGKRVDIAAHRHRFRTWEFDE